MVIDFTSSPSPLSGSRGGVRSGPTVPEGGWFHLQVNLKEQGQLRCQDEFIVCCGRKKYLRHVFLFEDLILFSKTKKVDGGYDTYMYKQSFKVTRLPLTGRRWVSGPGLLGVSRDTCYLLFSVILCLGFENLRPSKTARRHLSFIVPCTGSVAGKSLLSRKLHFRFWHVYRCGPHLTELLSS